MCRFMAKVIKDTPVLKGKDAKRFIEDICMVVREDKAVIKKARATFEKFRKIATFPI